MPCRSMEYLQVWAYHYRNLIQPAQWKATGLECDKMSRQAVAFHMDHIIGEIKKHLGDLLVPVLPMFILIVMKLAILTWTPKMREEFLARRGYDLTPYLPIFAGRMSRQQKGFAKIQKRF